MSADAAEQVLRKRARDLARHEEAERPGFPITLFRRGGMICAARVDEVAGAGTLRQLTAVPGGPPWMAGAVFHRGEVLTLLDLPALWGMDLRGVVDMQSFIVLSDGKARVGILVEDLLGVRDLEEAPLAWKGEARVGVVEVARFREEAVLVVSAGALLADGRLAGTG